MQNKNFESIKTEKFQLSNYQMKAIVGGNDEGPDGPEVPDEPTICTVEGAEDGDGE